MMKLIKESELKKLIFNSEKLRRLEAGGVDNWSWYSESLNDPNSLDDWEDESLPKFLDQYESLEHYIEFNH